MGRPRVFEFVLLLLAAAFALYGFGPPRAVFGYRPDARSDSALRIVTWNIGQADGTRTRRAGSDEGAFQQIRETLRELDADVSILQEVSADVLRSMADGLPGSSTAFSGAPNAGCGIITQRGHLVHLDGLEGASGDPVHVLFRPREGRALQVIGLHADAWSASRRNQEIGSAVDLMEETAEFPLHVLAGDLNLDVDLGGGKDLFTEDEYLDVQTYNYVVERMHDAASDGGPTAEPDRRLDYIFIWSRTGDLGIQDAGVWRGRRADGMDHHPVVVDIARN